MQQSVVSIIIPCYNQALYLQEAVESVIAQSYQNWECIIVNDGSTDNTQEVAQELVKRDKRIFYYEKENGGLSYARNFGIEKAVGHYILPLDADDKINIKYIELAVEEIKKDMQTKVVYCEARLFGLRNVKWELPPFNLEELARNNIIFCTALYRKNDWVRVGGYDVNMKSGFEDWDFWISLLKDGGNAVKLPYEGFLYRRTSGSMVVQTMKSSQRQKIENYIFKKHSDFILTQLGNSIFLSRELKKYKNSYERIAATLPYRIYLGIRKKLLNIKR